MDTEYDYEGGINQRNAPQGAQVIQIDNGKAIAVAAICSAFCALSAVIAVWAGFEARDAQTEYRVMLNHTMELEAAVRQLEKRDGK